MKFIRSLSVKTVLVLAPVLAVLAGGGALALAGVGGDDQVSIPRLLPAQTMNPDLADAFGVLRERRNTNDVIPASAAANLQQVNPFGMNPDLARRGLSENDIDFFVVPGEDALCLATVSKDYPDGAGGTCSKLSAALRGEIVMGTLTEGGVRMSGILPDGVSQVTVVPVSGADISAPVTNNVYSIQVDKSVAGIRFTLDGKDTEIATPFETPTP